MKKAEAQWSPTAVKQHRPGFSQNFHFHPCSKMVSWSRLHSGLCSSQADRRCELLFAVILSGCISIILHLPLLSTCSLKILPPRQLFLTLLSMLGDCFWCLPLYQCSSWASESHLDSMFPASSLWPNMKLLANSHRPLSKSLHGAKGSSLC